MPAKKKSQKASDELNLRANKKKIITFHTH